MKTLTFNCNTKPLMGYIALLEHLIELGKLSFDLSDLSFELARIDTYNSATSTGELFITLYPSDSLLCFVAAALAGDTNA
jgi:hypothetical protein